MANEYIDIFDSTSAPEIELVELSLRHHGIRYRVLNKKIIETTNILLTGGIGARVQVKKSDMERAIQVLADAGINVGDNVKPYSWIIRLGQITHNIPLLNRLSVPLRLLTIVGIVSGLVLFTVMALLKEDAGEVLTKHVWCVEKITHNGEALEPYSTGLQVVFGNGCRETASFNAWGRVHLPGIQSPAVLGNWEAINSKEIRINELDGLAQIYEGTYRLKSGWNSRIHLVSEKTEITLYVWTIY